MRHLENTGLLILSGFFFSVFKKPDYTFICAFLFLWEPAAQAISPNQKNCICFCAQPSWLLLFALPEMCAFFSCSILCSDPVSFLSSYVCRLLSLPLYNPDNKLRYLFFFSFWGILFFIVAFFLQLRTESEEKLRQDFMKLRDDSTEKNILLEEKNHMLVEKQNYEIYTATLKERNRIAREIHDNVGHLPVPFYSDHRSRKKQSAALRLFLLFWTVWIFLLIRQ